MDFKEYQEKARSIAVYPNIGDNLSYPSLGLAGEAGEVCEKVKKLYRDDEGILSNERRDAIKKELGDVLWYVANVAAECKLEMCDIAQANIDKLFSRKERGVLKGSGDNR